MKTTIDVTTQETGILMSFLWVISLAELRKLETDRERFSDYAKRVRTHFYDFHRTLGVKFISTIGVEHAKQGRDVYLYPQLRSKSITLLDTIMPHAHHLLSHNLRDMTFARPLFVDDHPRDGF